MLADRSLHQIERIPTIRSIDNLEYDAQTGNFYGGAIGCLKHLHVIDPKLVKGDDWKRDEIYFPGGAIEIYKEDGKYKSRELMMMNGYFGITSAVRDGDVVMLGSWFDKGVVFCKPRF